MTLPDALTRLLEPCALALAHSLWQAGFITLVTWALLKTIPARFWGTRYWLCVLALGAVVLSFALTLACFASKDAAEAPGALPGSPQVLAPLTLPPSVPVAQAPSGSLPAPALTASPSTPLPASLPASFPPSVTPASPTASTTLWHSFLALRIPDPAIPYILGTWLLGTLLMLLRTARALYLGLRIKHTASPMNLGSEFDLFSQLARQMRVTTRARFATSLHVTVPAVVGFFYPLVLLPARGLSALPPEDLKLILAHELAHIKRHDALVDFLQSLIESALFFNPGVWWLSSTIRAERESACDAIAIQTTSAQPDQYASALVHWARLISSSQPGLAFAGQPKNLLLHRIKRILLPSARPQLPGPWLALACLLLLASLFYASLPKPAVAQPDLRPSPFLARYPDLESLNSKRYADSSAFFPPFADRTITLTLKTPPGQALPPDTKAELFWSQPSSESQDQRIPLTPTGPSTFTTLIHPERQAGGMWSLIAQAPGYLTAEFSPVTANSSENADFTATLTPAAPRTIRVVNADNTPAPGVTVFVTGLTTANYGKSQYPHLSWQQKHLTDARGNVTLTSYSKSYYVTAIAPQAQSSANTGKTDSDTVTLTLKPGQSRSAQVVDADTGAPIPNARILVGEPYRQLPLWNSPQNLDRFTQIATTDAQGRFTTPCLADQSPWLNLWAIGPDGQIGFTLLGEPQTIKAGKPITLTGAITGKINRLPTLNGKPVLPIRLGVPMGAPHYFLQNSVLFHVPIQPTGKNAGRFTLTAPSGTALRINPAPQLGFSLDGITAPPGAPNVFAVSPSTPEFNINLNDTFGAPGTPDTRVVRIRPIGPNGKTHPAAKIVIPVLTEDYGRKIHSLTLTTDSSGVARFTVTTPANLAITGDIPATTARGLYLDAAIPPGDSPFELNLPAFPVGSLLIHAEKPNGTGPLPTLHALATPIQLPQGLQKLPNRFTPDLTLPDNALYLDHLPLNGRYRITFYDQPDGKGNPLGVLDNVSLSSADPDQEFTLTLNADNRLTQARRTDKNTLAAAPAPLPGESTFKTNRQRLIFQPTKPLNLPDAIQELARQAQVKIEIDFNSLNNAGVDFTFQPITVTAPFPLPIDAAVTLALYKSIKPAKGKTYPFDALRVVPLADKFILGSRTQALRRTFEEHPYDISAILAPKDAKPLTPQALTDLISQSIGKPHDWKPDSLAWAKIDPATNTLTLGAPKAYHDLIPPLLEQLAITHQSDFIQTRIFDLTKLTPPNKQDAAVVRADLLQALQQRPQAIWTFSELSYSDKTEPQIIAQGNTLSITARLPDILWLQQQLTGGYTNSALFKTGLYTPFPPINDYILPVEDLTSSPKSPLSEADLTTRLKALGGPADWLPASPARISFAGPGLLLFTGPKSAAYPDPAISLEKVQQALDVLRQERSLPPRYQNEPSPPASQPASTTKPATYTPRPPADQIARFQQIHQFIGGNDKRADLPDRAYSTPLENARKLFQSQSGVQITIDWPNLASLGITPDTSAQIVPEFPASPDDLTPLLYALYSLRLQGFMRNAIPGETITSADQLTELFHEHVLLVPHQGGALLSTRPVALRATRKTLVFTARDFTNATDANTKAQVLFELMTLIPKNLGMPQDWLFESTYTATIGIENNLIVTLPESFIPDLHRLIALLKTTGQTKPLQTLTFDTSDLNLPMLGLNAPFMAPLDIRSALLTRLDTLQSKWNQGQPNNWRPSNLPLPPLNQYAVTLTPTGITVTTTPAGLLWTQDQLAQYRAQAAAGQPDRRLPTALTNLRNQTYNKIRLAHTQPVSLPDTAPRPLQQALDQILTTRGIPFETDWQALKSIGVTPQTPVTPPTPQTSVLALLRATLKQATPPEQLANRAFATEHFAGIKISTRQSLAKIQPSTQNINDLLHPKPPGKPVPLDQILTRLKTVSDPSDWLYNGVCTVTPTPDGLLKFTTPFEERYTVVDALNDLREENNIPFPAWDDGSIPIAWRPLSKPAKNYQTPPIPFSQAIANISKTSGIKLEIQAKTFSDAKLPLDTLVSIAPDAFPDQSPTWKDVLFHLFKQLTPQPSSDFVSYYADGNTIRIAVIPERDDTFYSLQELYLPKNDPFISPADLKRLVRTLPGAGDWNNDPAWQISGDITVKAPLEYQAKIQQLIDSLRTQAAAGQPHANLTNPTPPL
jgi:beta-lactamase regulating signal transducer with metallopeptidase domain